MDGFQNLNRLKPANSTARVLNHVHRYRKLVFRFWWAFILCVAVALGIQSQLLKRVRPSFVSDGRMIVNVKLSIPNANIYSEELNNFFGTQVALMQSDSVVNRVKARLNNPASGLTPSPVGIQVSLAPKTSIFNLRAIGADPKYTAAYLEATMEEYINFKKELLENASASTKSGIRDERVRILLELQKSKQDILNFQSSNSVVFLQQNGRNSAADYLATLSRQLAEKKSELQLLKAPGALIPLLAVPAPQPNPAALANAATNGATGDSNEVAATTDTNVLIQNLPVVGGVFAGAIAQAKIELASLNAERDRIRQAAPTAHYDLDPLEKKIAQQQQLLQFFTTQIQQESDYRQRALEIEVAELEKQISEWEGKAFDVSKRLSDFEVLKDNSRRLETMYDQLSVTLQTLDIDGGIGQDSVTILEAATPAMPNPTNTRKQLIMAGLIGFMAWIGILFLLDQLDDRLNSRVEVEELLDKPILAQLPRMVPARRKAGVSILQTNDERHMMVEAYYNLRSALVYQTLQTEHPRSIVITSASPSDGKSMIAANLAITLAHSGARVLLVDADLRRGVLHKHFSTDASPGLADVLAQRCDWRQAVVPTGIQDLHLLPCGAPERHSGSLFAKQTQKFLGEIAGQYDYYLFDTAPVLAADDVSSLAPHVDGLIMVVRAGYTSGRLAQAALELLTVRKVNVIGLVFNAVQPSTSQYFYYRDKNYYPQAPVGG